MEMVNALGRRKSAVARIFVKEGTGKITINKKDLQVYFPSSILQFIVKQPLTKLDVAEKYDIKVNLDGGGFTGQSQALRLAIARALVKINPEDKKALRSEGFLTRDAREVERKKPGRPKARRRFQFSKR
ncbi:MAG: 30S ribosomal protein S9 [Bacteroidaceae bacterium]|jgi:small subunit ribosomal protein S9|nr:30S ribosomal protein S9 [Bacteroidaceae bacterium]MBQ5705096.1 30S ribosomal protein S9 [Bacteroidaceae bacterium]MBR5511251.1 30S ribosomal protein S9 [Bacteroidaceae bacterium]